MKKINGLLILAATVSLTACSWTLPECKDELNECGRDSAYTEERTVKANRNRVVAAPMPEPVVMPAPEPVAVVEPPPPPPPEPVIVDTQVMTTAEPQFTQVSK